MAVHHSSDQLMLALAAQCMQTSLISFDKILISYDHRWARSKMLGGHEKKSWRGVIKKIFRGGLGGRRPPLDLRLRTQKKKNFAGVSRPNFFFAHRGLFFTENPPEKKFSGRREPAKNFFWP